MATPTVTDTRTFGREAAYVLESILPGIKDNIHLHSPGAGIFLSQNLNEMFGGTRLAGSGRKMQTGGEKVRINHRLGKSTNSKRLAGGWDTVNTAPQDVVRPSFANWKHYSGAVTLSFYEQLINTGDEALADMAASETQNEVLSLVDLVMRDIFGSGGSDAVTSLADIASANDALQSLNGATTGLEAWNARGLSARGTAASSVSFASSGSFATNGLSDMRTAWWNCSEGSEQPTAILSGQTNAERYEGRLQPQERFTNTAMADGGFQNIAFKTVPFIADSICEEEAAGTIFFVNTRVTYVKVLTGADFTVRPPIEAQNQEAESAKVLFKAQLVTEDRRLNNKITGNTD